jgi:arthrofactin-type cyclic lipopeptide synthetase C
VGRSPLVVIPGAGESLRSLNQLVASFDEGLPILGMQPRGVAGEGVPHGSVEAAAEFYATAFATELPEHETVHLLGVGFGGWVAFDMVIKLRQKGTMVSSLTLVDSPAPLGAEQPYKVFTRTDSLLSVIELYQTRLNTELGINIDDFLALDATEQLVQLHKELVRLGALPKQSHPNMVLGIIRAFETNMATRYIPSEVLEDTSIYLVSFEESTDTTELEATANAWRAFAPNLQCSLEAGSTGSAIVGQHVGAFADSLMRKFG